MKQWSRDIHMIVLVMTKLSGVHKSMSTMVETWHTFLKLLVMTAIQDGYQMATKMATRC